MIFLNNHDLPVIAVHAKTSKHDTRKLLLCIYVPSWENNPSKWPKNWFIPSLGQYLQIWFGDLSNFTFFGFYGSWNVKNQIRPIFLSSFWRIKSKKVQYLKSPRKVQTKFQNFWMGGSLKKGHRSNFQVTGIAIWSFCSHCNYRQIMIFKKS